MPYTEANYENAVLEVFRDTLGYSHIYAPDFARDYTDPLHKEELLAALHRVNPQLPEVALYEAVYKLRNFEGGTVLQKNIHHGLPPKRVSVSYFDSGEQRSSRLSSRL